MEENDCCSDCKKLNNLNESETAIAMVELEWDVKKAKAGLVLKNKLNNIKKQVAKDLAIVAKQNKSINLLHTVQQQQQMTP